MPHFLTILSQSGAVLSRESGQKLAHNPLNISVCQGLLLILQREAKGILFLSGGNLVSPIDIKQGDILKEFLRRLERAAV